jgi:hypothetical protein
MPARTRQALVAFVACLVLCGCTSTPTINPSPPSASTLIQSGSSASPSKSPSQAAAEDTTVKAYTALWKFMAGQAATRDVEAEFSPYMRNTRNNGTAGFLDQSESYVASINNQNMMATAVPKFTIQSSRDATPIENRPTVYVRGCADLSTTSIKNLETGATMPLNPAKDARVFTVEQFSDGWRVAEGEQTTDTTTC